jgi:hypothetical protein
VVSYIFTYRQTTADRTANLFTTLEWLKTVKVPNLEVVIVEQDTESKYLNNLQYPFPIKHIFAYNPKLFNRSWGFNVAIRNTTNPILFFADSDMIIPPSQVHETINLLNSQFDVVSPFSQCLELNPEETKALNLQTWDYSLNKNPRGGMNFCSGIVAYNRPAIERIFAWDERFEGWGGEDDIQFMKTRQTLKFVMLNSKCYHLFHERSKNDGSNQHDNYATNLRLFWQYHYNPAQILIDMRNYSNWGNLNKYR